jgi:hypothetical protein
MADSGFIPVHFQGYLGLVKACFQVGLNLVSFYLGKLFVSHCASLTWRLEEAVNHTAACPLTNKY